MFKNSSKRKKITSRTIANVIGNFVNSFPAIPLGPFFYRNLETQKILGLKLQNGEFDTNITLNVHSEKEIYWWKNNIFEFLLILTFLTQTSQYMLMQV